MIHHSQVLRRIQLLFLVFLLNVPFVLSQGTELYEIREEPHQNWISKQRADLQRAAIILNQDLLRNLRNGAVNQFTVQGLSGELHQVEITRIVEQLDGDWSLLGHIDGNWMDSFTLSYSEGTMLSSIRAITSHHFLDIRFDESQNEHYLMQIDPHERDELFCGFDHETIVEVPEEGSIEMEIQEDPGPRTSAVIDVMVVYTPAAQAWAAANGGGINNVINQAMAISQNSVDNSQINLQFRLVHRSAVNYVETGNSRTDLNDLTNRVIPGVQQLRNQYAADLVVMLTDTDDMGGIAWLTSQPNGSSAYGYSITRVQQAAWTTTMVHEFAHNMGSHHSRNQAIQPAPEQGGVFNYSTGWRWTGANNQSYSSVMTYPQNSTVVDLFSNPFILNQGAPTGSYNGDYAPADNSRSMIEMMYVVESYRTEGIVSPPTVLTSTITNVLSTSAQTGGEVIDDGGITVTSRGICWSTQQNPSLSDECRTSGTGIGGFDVTLTNLAVNTTYYIRAFATNSGGTSYGSQQSFTTISGLPAVTTALVRDISFKSAIGVGMVTDPGSSAVIERGICWSTRRNPGLSENCRKTAPGTGAFSTLIDQLIRDTMYFVRAYATNGQGTAYGEERSFVTLPVLIDANRSSISVSTDKVQANNQNRSIVTVIARDFEGVRLLGFDIQLIPEQGTPQVSPLLSTTNSNGEASFVITNSKPEQFIFGAKSGDVELSSTANIQFIGIDAELTTIALSSNIVQADGAAEARITVTARDQDNVPFSNLRVELIPDGGSSVIRAVRQTTDVNGEAIFNVSNQVAERIRYRARGLGITTTSSAEVSFVSIDPDRSSVTANVETVAANGVDAAIITVKAIDINNEAIQGALIRLSDSGAGTSITPGEQRTDADGLARFEIRNSIVAVVDFTATAIRTFANVPIREKVTIAFIPVAPVTLTATEVGTRSFQANWELVVNAEKYLLDVATDSSFTNILNRYESLDVGMVTAHRVTDVNPGTDYIYRVRSVNGGVLGAASKPILTTTFPEIPVGLQATDNNALTFIANWQVTDGARAYRIDVSTDPEFSVILSDYNNRNVGSLTSYEIGGLESGRTYYYRIRAEAGVRTSMSSNIIAATTLKASPGNSIISQQQSRILANGNQTNEVIITVKSEGGVLLKGLTVELIPDGVESQIDAVQSETDAEGIARFHLSSRFSGNTTYEIVVNGIRIGGVTVEFLSDEGVLTLGNNYPNPFVGSTILPVTIPTVMDVEMQVFDTLGKPVQTIMNGSLEPGYYEVSFDGHGLSSGIYICRLIADGEVLTERMVMVK